MTQTAMTLDEGVMKAVVTTAILEAIGPDQQRAIISDAIKALMEDEKDRYGSRPIPGTSPITQAFKRAVLDLADKCVRDLVHEDEIRSAVEAAIRQRVEVLIGQDEYSLTWLDEAIATAVQNRVASVVKVDR